MSSSNENILKHVESLGSIAKDITEDAVDILQEKASKYYEKGVKQAETMELGLEKKIRDNPLMALFVAAGAGLLVGTIWNRRK